MHTAFVLQFFGDRGSCATNRKVAGSIPASVSGFFIDIKILPIALWPLTEMSTRSIS